MLLEVWVDHSELLHTFLKNVSPKGDSFRPHMVSVGCDR